MNEHVPQTPKKRPPDRTVERPVTRRNLLPPMLTRAVHDAEHLVHLLRRHPSCSDQVREVLRYIAPIGGTGFLRCGDCGVSEETQYKYQHKPCNHKEDDQGDSNPVSPCACGCQLVSTVAGRRSVGAVPLPERHPPTAPRRAGITVTALIASRAASGSPLGWQGAAVTVDHFSTLPHEQRHCIIRGSSSHLHHKDAVPRDKRGRRDDV